MKKKYFMLLLIVSGIPFASGIRAQDSLFVNFTGMNPHLNQVLTLYLRDTVSGDISDTVIVNPVETADFQVALGPIVAGNSYFLDFYADHNSNGMYDVPPVDHAWRIVLDTIVEGDTTINFAHNTDFTDITWMTDDTVNQITLNFVGMNPHLGQDLYLYLRNTDDLVSVDSMVVAVENADFSVVFDSVDAGDYNLDFYADHNQNGMYDTPPTDHAWRIVLEGFEKDTVLEFVHNTDFTDIFPAAVEDTVMYYITVNFTGMTPHVDQNLYLYVRNADDGEILDSLVISPVDSADFSVVFDSVSAGDYHFDFYADLNQNGMYDVPPADHAWRIELIGFDSDTTLDFAHNTDFTDIFPAEPVDDMYMLTISFVGMNPHIDQVLVLYLRDPSTGDFIDSVKVEPVTEADFEVVFESVNSNVDYNLDFYADLNMNGVYDAPPVDHAWRILLTGISADTTIEFTHNTEFTDIGLGGEPTPVDKIEDPGFMAYPNPVRNELYVLLKKSAADLKIYDVTGAVVLQRTLSASDKVVQLDVSRLNPGMYILRLKSDSGTGEYKFLKE